MASIEKEKAVFKPSIKQSIIDEFEKAYAFNCDQQKASKRMRAVSTDNPFDPTNVPPAEYLQDDVNFLEKPGTFNLKKADTLKYQYCGKLSKIGDEILKIGSYKAKHLVTGNWQFKQYNADGSIRALPKD